MLISVKLILKKIVAKLNHFWDNLIKAMQSIAKKLQKKWNIYFLGCKTFIKKYVDAKATKIKHIFDMIIRFFKYIEGSWEVHERVYQVPEEDVPEEFRKIPFQKEYEMSDKTEMILQQS